MSKRLQVVFKDPEYRDIRDAARSRSLSVAEWVRLALRKVRDTEPSGDLGKKLESIRASARLDFPTADIGQMLSEIERGYSAGTDS